MKNIFIFSLLMLGVGNIQVSAQPGETKGWPSAERYGFISECIKAARKNMSEDTARFYCYCMIFKMEEKYPTIDSAAGLTEEKMMSPEWQKEIKACLQGYWTGKDRNEFLSNCIETAKEGMGKEKAESYCACMLYKVEVMYPISSDAAEHLTAEKIISPEWKKIITSCLEF